MVGHLTTLWANVLELAEDGDITKWSVEDIADYAGWEDDPKWFYTALLNDKDGWLDEKDGKRLIHDWWEYAGRYLKAKYKTHNPNKLTYIETLYGKTLGKPKTDFGELSNQSINLSNQSIDPKTIVSKERIDKIRFSFLEIINIKLETLSGNDCARLAKEIKDLIIRADFKDELVISGLEWISKKPYSWTLGTLLTKWPEFLKEHNAPSITKYFKKEKGGGQL